MFIFILDWRETIPERRDLLNFFQNRHILLVEEVQAVAKLLRQRAVLRVGAIIHQDGVVAPAGRLEFIESHLDSVVDLPELLIVLDFIQVAQHRIRLVDASDKLGLVIVDLHFISSDHYQPWNSQIRFPDFHENGNFLHRNTEII
jgi:hypothetical protein